MRVPTGNFGYATPGVARTPDTSQTAEAAANLGRTIVRNAITDRALASEERIRVARARAATAFVDDETQVKITAQDITDRMDRGELDHTQAEQEFERAAAKLKRPDIPDLDGPGIEALDRGMESTRMQVSGVLRSAVGRARQREGDAQLDRGLDALGKQAGLPGEDVAAVITKAETFASAARAAGVPADVIERKVQAFRDGSWTAHAQNRLNQYENDGAGLKALERDLKARDGLYADKLDANRRTALIAAVGNARERLEVRAERAALKREARADRTIAEIERQIASGVPATADMWVEWERQVGGTPAAETFRALKDGEREVQAVLRMPPDVQRKFVQDREAELLTKGGDLKDAANVARLRTAVDRNVALLQSAPLAFEANRAGEEVAPLDFGKFGDAEGEAEIAGQFRDRAVTLHAMRKQYGEAVPLKPLLPQEAAVLTDALGRGSPRQQAGSLAQLRGAIGDDQLYAAALQQIMPDAPVTAVAGMLAAKQKTATLERNWFSPNVTATSGDVAATVLEGHALLNPTKAAAKEDGKPATKLFLPESRTLQERFVDAVGGAFAGRPAAADVAFQVVQAYYVGKAAQTGRLAAQQQDIDTKLVREAITATLGTVVDFNGGGEVLAPWGMDETTFTDRATAAVRAKLPVEMQGRETLFGLRNRGERTYYVTQGRNFLTDGNGNPVVIDVGGP